MAFTGELFTLFKVFTLYNQSMYRLTNKSPFRNPRTPGRTPLGSVINRVNIVDNGGSPKLANIKASAQKKTPFGCAKKLVECQVTARQLSEEEVQELWKNTTLRQISKILGVLSVTKFTNTSHIKGKWLHFLGSTSSSCFYIGKWVLWNVTHIGTRGVVQPMEEPDSPPSWVLYGKFASFYRAFKWVDSLFH